MLDTISDMLTRIRNAQIAGHKEVAVPFSKLKLAIAKILEEKDFIGSAQEDGKETSQKVVIQLKYEKISNNKKVPAIKGIKRVSKEGQRIYVRKNEIKSIKNGYGISVVSTSKGVMTGEDARKRGLGGEVICEVW
ncbi:MAG: 30S ribosomal protein S8 [uncultured bacterium]|nr:MAG: 30S ribosomal protein S8 [uncultured bacterium]HBR71848.1 30S ribosomal protein S8 [Candidatus Moranbacteria bacterium]